LREPLVLSSHGLSIARRSKRRPPCNAGRGAQVGQKQDSRPEQFRKRMRERLCGPPSESQEVK
jgi:hypothetical protein